MIENPSDSLEQKELTKGGEKMTYLTPAEANMHKMDADRLDENMAYAYITFKDEKDYALAFRAFNNVSTCWRCCVKCCSCCCTSIRDRHMEKEFHGDFLVVEDATEPDFIMWGNLGIGKTSRFFRNLCIALTYLIIIAGSTIGMALFTVYSANLNSEYSSTKTCPTVVAKS
jgi:RNA recognition motif-containing protein